MEEGGRVSGKLLRFSVPRFPYLLGGDLEQLSCRGPIVK